MLYLGLFLNRLNFESCFDILVSGAGMLVYMKRENKDGSIIFAVGSWAYTSGLGMGMITKNSEINSKLYYTGFFF